MSARSFDAIVIGAGVNGLVAAAALSTAGRRVIVLERSRDTGGQSRPIEFAPGFRAPLGDDCGWLPPSVERGLGLVRPPSVESEVAISAVDDDGRVLSLATSSGRASEAVRTLSARDSARWTSFTQRLRRLAGFLEALYQTPPPDIEATSVRDLASLAGLGRKFRALGPAAMAELLRVMPMSVQDLLDDEFESPLLKAAVGAGGVRDIRQGPRSGGTSFVLLHYLAGAAAGAVRGRPAWREGPDAIAQAVEAMARRLGVTIRTDADVRQILVKDDAAAGVALKDGEEISARAVVSTADPSSTLLGMIDPVWLDPEVLRAVRNVKFRGCTSYVLFACDQWLPTTGTTELTEEAGRVGGVISLTPSLDALERAYDAAKYGRVGDAPHIEISIPSLRWPQLAPANKQVVVARVQYTPYYLRDGEWDSDASSALGEAVTKKIGLAFPGFADRVTARVVMTPRDLERRFGVTEGSLTHGELTLDQILFMRPIPGWGRHAMPVDGLYLGGAGAHPGPGVLGGSGWLAARRILADS